MRKKITMIALVILCMSAFSIQAGIRIGVKAGINLANPALNSDAFQTENFTGYQVGPILEISGLPLLDVDAALLYSRQGIIINGVTSLVSSSSSKVNYEEKVHTLDIPVNLKFKFSLADQAGVYLSAGPYVSFKLDSQVTLDQIKQDQENKNFGVGLNFGAGVMLLKHLQVGVNYQMGLNDDYNNFSLLTDLKDTQAKTRIWSITAAYFF